ncbi:MAG: hypothetical protein KA457_03220 [Chitinophagales bacterium]|nr:hypothetical protein [Chitinophagales bacterium]
MMYFHDISKFENKRVLIVGDIILDEFIETSSNRNSPEYKNIPILNVHEKKQYLGGAANVALNLKKLHAIPYLVGCLGLDTAAEFINNLLEKEAISNTFIYQSKEIKTTIKQRVFKNKLPIIRLDDEQKSAYSILTHQFIIAYFIDAIRQHKPHIIILQDYNKGVLNSQTIPELITIAQKNSIPICVDPKYDNWQLYQNVDLFKPNEIEFAFISGSENKSEMQLKENAKTLEQKITFKNLLVTLGAEGNYIYNKEISKVVHLTTKLQLADVCGAGDTVIAVASLGMACGFSLEQIAELANKAGFIVCQKEDVQPVLFAELAHSS